MSHSSGFRVAPSRQLFVVAMLLLFVGSFSVLNLLGFSMGDKDAGLLARLHPSFYLILPFLLLQLSSRGINGWDPASHEGAQPLPHHGKLRRAYLLHACFVLIAIVAPMLDITHGSLAITATTFLLPLFCIAGITHLSPKDLRLIRNALLLLMLANSLLGILEKTFDFRLFTYTVGLTEKLNDPRPTAWFSHPLNNALLTALVLAYLLYSRVAKGLGLLRFPMIVVHGYALICFGGRTALVAILGLVVFDYCLSIARTVLSGKGVMPLLMRSLAVVAGICMLAALYHFGYLDDLLARFRDDRGSASVRWNTLELVRNLDFRSILFGLDIHSIQYVMGYYDVFNIEFSWLHIILTQGLLVGGALLASLSLLLFRAAEAIGRPATYMILLFIVVTFGYTSIGSASLLLSQLALMIAALLETNFFFIKKQHA